MSSVAASPYGKNRSANQAFRECLAKGKIIFFYSKGYRERSHFCLAMALEALFVEEGLLAGRYVRRLQDTMALREDADYSGSFSKEGASMSISNAGEFIGASRNLLRQSR